MNNYLKRHKNILFFLLIVSGIYFLYFHNIWSYKLLDVDETRYVDMAKKMYETKEFLTLYLNGEYFFEKPPLFFWIECLFFKLFGSVSEGAARIPVALQSFFTALVVYFTGAKVVSKRFGLTAAVILGTSLEFIILTKIAILDMLLTSCVTISTFCGFMTFFVKPENKKYLWRLFYVFSAFAVLAKGIPGFIIPFGTMFFAGVYTGKLREFFKPQYICTGGLLFLLIVLPWHIIMLKTHGSLFFNDYIIKHHIARFAGADVIHRKRPFYYYFITILWGLFPWIFSLISMLIKKYRSFKYKPFTSLDTKEQFISLNIIGALFTFIFFSISGTKLITYILPIYPFLAVILASYWNVENRKKLFIIISAVMILASAFITPAAFNIDYGFGQNELMKYAGIAKKQHKTIVTYKTGRKYSLLYYSGQKRIKFLFEEDKKSLPQYLNDKNTFVIVKNKELNTSLKRIKYKIFKKGKKYSVITY